MAPIYILPRLKAAAHCQLIMLVMQEAEGHYIALHYIKEPAVGVKGTST
jgi:hypothetical protein